MKSTNARPAALSVTGTTLEVEIRRLFRSLNYTRTAVSETLAWVERRGTAAGCPSVDAEDVDALNALVARHTGDVEGDPAGWPAWTDEECWVPTDPGPDPSAADASWWAVESAAHDSMTLGLIPSDLAAAIARTSPVGHDA